MLPDKNELPFGKSIAFLVGVSEYEHLSTQLPFVKNDLAELRKFLLDKGGFDEVYVAADSTVKESLVKEYIFNIFPEKLQKNDRLLFYYSGHGADIGSGVGYMQFSGARPGKFTVDQVLKIGDCTEWSKVLPAAHVLFIYDCCASGLGFTPKGEDKYTRAEILKTLSRNGSRTVITAGTAEEKTFGVENQNHSVFTKAMLNALNRPQNTEGFITISQLFADIESEVKQFSQIYGKNLTPRRWELDDTVYRGTFLFIDNSGNVPEMPEDFSRSLKAVPKGTQLKKEYGFITVIPSFSGQLYVDGAFNRKVESGEGMTFQIPVGNHRLELRADSKTAQEYVQVEKGKTLEVPLFTNRDSEPPEFWRSEAVEVPGPPDPAEEVVYTPDSPDPAEEVVDTPDSPDTAEEVETSKVHQPETNDGKKGFTNSIGQEFVYIEPGTFMMGSPENEPRHQYDETQHKVTLTKGFYMQTTEVTQGQWKAVMGNNPSHFQDCGDNCPVEQISWENAQEFIKKLSRKEGKEYRLPTEAEWEYAARAGTSAPFAFGKCLSADQANYDGDYPLDDCPKGKYREKPVPVGSVAANAWGLYDMHGNVWEWCQDWYGDYSANAVTNPAGPDSGPRRVLRGGGWNDVAGLCRAARRLSYSPGIRYKYYGFRLVSPSGQQAGR